MKSSAQPPDFPPALLDAAAKWVAAHDGGLSAAQQAEFQRWLLRDARHALAFEKLSSAWGRLDAPRARGTAAPLQRQLRARADRRLRRRAVAGGVMVAAFAVALAVFGPLRRVEPVAGGAEIAAATPSPEMPAAIDSGLLPDGSRVEVDDGAEIAVAFTERERRVRLVRGQAHFEVLKDPARRAFIVEAGGVEVRAVGTAFAVRLDPGEVEVLVTEGRVAVGRPQGALNSADVMASGSAMPIVPAGSRVLVRLNVEAEAPQVSVLSEAQFSERLAWRVPRLDFSGTPLAEAVAQMNRHNRVQLILADEELGAMQMSGLFRADNVDGFVRVLEFAGVQIERRGESEILLRRR